MQINCNHCGGGLVFDDDACDDALLLCVCIRCGATCNCKNTSSQCLANSGWSKAWDALAKEKTKLSLWERFKKLWRQ